MEKKKTLYIDMDNVLVDFQSAFPKISPELLTKFKGNEDEIPDIFSKMDPMTGAVNAFFELSKHFDTYILSTAPWNNPSAWVHKLEWVKKNLKEQAYKRLILTHHKNLNSGHFLVDDRKKNGADYFKGEHIHFGQPIFPNWDSVVEYLMTRVGQ